MPERPDILVLEPDSYDPAALPQSRIALLPRESLQRQQPYKHLLLQSAGQILARASIWNGQTPLLDGQPVGLIGHYAAFDAASGLTLLRDACNRLHRLGRSTIVGPMDGSTWNSYRFVTEPMDEPPFFLEPANPPDYPAHWQQVGFEPLANYFSSINNDLSIEDPRTADALARFEADGGSIAPIDLDRFDDDLRDVGRLSIEAFDRNFLYTPTTLDAFVAQYTAVRSHLHPELVLLARRAGELVGFVFGVPNLAEAARGEPIRSAIAKSLAVKPGRTGAGLGSVLMDLFQRNARRLGFERVIWALMHEQNRSLTISRRYGQPIRRYTLFVRRSELA